LHFRAFLDLFREFREATLSHLLLWYEIRLSSFRYDLTLFPGGSFLKGHLPLLFIVLIILVLTLITAISVLIAILFRVETLWFIGRLRLLLLLPLNQVTGSYHVDLLLKLFCLTLKV
jgi:hypothetical protein